MRCGWRLLLFLSMSTLVLPLCSVASNDSTPIVHSDHVIKDGQEQGVLLCDLCDAKRRFHEYHPDIEVGFDFRFRTTYHDAAKLDRKASGHDNLFQRYMVRGWLKTRHAEGLYSNIRIVSEPRYLFRPDNLQEQYIRDEIIIDQLNLEWEHFLDTGISATIGRQDIRLGSGWLVTEGTTVDGSRTLFFDAIRFTCQNEDDSRSDLVLYDNHANSSEWIRPINDSDLELEEQDDQGVMLYFSDIPWQDNLVDAYFFYKHDTERILSSGTEGEIYTLGASFRKNINERTKCHIELTPQFGHKNGKELSAFAAKSRLEYDLNDNCNSNIHFVYDYLSGDDDPDKYFDKLWGRFPQYSELYDTWTSAIDGRVGDASNLHRLNIGLSTEPAKNTKLECDYHILFADENTSLGGTNGLSKSGNFRGQLFTLQLKHTANEHIRHRMNAELFLPGDYYNDDRNDVGTFLRYELLFTW